VSNRFRLILSPQKRLLTTAPSANLPDESLPAMSNVTEPGVYFGYAQVAGSADSSVYPMVMSLGRNPFYKNERTTAVRSTVHATRSPDRMCERTGNPYNAQL
jgi:hypothetical protein